MRPIEVKQVKEIILVSDDVHASRRLYRETLGLAMPATPDRLNLARVGSQYLGAAQAGVMAHPGFTGRVHLGLEIDPTDFTRAVDHLRSQGIEVTDPSPAAWVHGHARGRRRLLPRSRREPDRALGSAPRPGALTAGTRRIAGLGIAESSSVSSPRGASRPPRAFLLGWPAGPRR